MKYKDYDKITDTIYSIDNITYLNFTTKLYIKNNNNLYDPIHREFNKEKSSMIKRKLCYYLSIDKYKTNDTDRVSIIINPQEFLIFKMSLNKVYEWFNSKDYSGLYTKIGDNLKIGITIPPLQVNASYNKIIAFEPSVIGEKYPAVRLYLNSNTNYTDMFINVFYGLLYIINGFNMIEYSAIMLNYLQRPEYGYNSMSFNEVEYPEYNTSVGGVNKIAEPERSLSFFDKISKLNG